MQSENCGEINLEGAVPSDRGYHLGCLGGPFPGELEHCLKKIDKAGLDLNFVPHLEYVSTMISEGESVWRNMTCVPTDDVHYYEAAYKQLFDSVSKNGFRGKIDISIAAEIDNSTFRRPDKTLQLIKRINKSKSDLGIKGRVTWNPNGDFHKSSSGAKICDNPKVLSQILESIDTISPSIYEEHGHIAYGSDGKPSYIATKEKFLNSLFGESDYFNSCAGSSKSVQKEIKEIKSKFKQKFRRNFSIGEFGLGNSGAYKGTDKSSETHYGDFLEQVHRDDPSAKITLWSSGAWDPFDFEKGNGINGDFKRVERGSGFFDYLESCSEPEQDIGHEENSISY